METNAPKKTLAIANIVAFVATVFVNYAANALPLNGRTAGEISDALPSFFTPAGYTFSIWGLIYLALGAFVVYQALPKQRNLPALRKIGWLFVLSSIFNSGWIFAWHYGQYILSIFLMVGILLTLVTIYVRLQNGERHNVRSFQQRLFIHFPFSLYLGWISVATIANIASVSRYVGWEGSGIPEPTWAAIMMLVAAGLATVILYERRDFTYAGVLVWALFGIRAAQSDVSIVANTAMIAAAIIVVAAFYGAWRTDSLLPLTEKLKSQPA